MLRTKGGRERIPQSSNARKESAVKKERSIILMQRLTEIPDNAYTTFSLDHRGENLSSVTLPAPERENMPTLFTALETHIARLRSRRPNLRSFLWNPFAPRFLGEFGAADQKRSARW
jgi:hypothetical protein